MKMEPREFLKLLKSKKDSQGTKPSIEDLRIEMDETAKRIPLAEGVSTHTADLNGVPCVRLEPATKSDTHILYMHGGGYIIGSPQSHMAFTSVLAKQAGANVWSIDYRLAPETPFPGALDDVVSSYQALLEIAGSADKIVIAGDSAGGGLTAASMLKAKNLGLPMPAALAMMSPFTDLSLSGDTHDTCVGRDFLADKETLDEMVEYYVADGDNKDPFASPLFGDLAGLPDMLIHVGSEEVLLSDSTRLAERAGGAGVSVELKVWPDMPHVFQLYAKFLEAGDQSLTEIADWIAEKLK